MNRQTPGRSTSPGRAASHVSVALGRIVALVRPDFAVFGTAPELGGAAVLVAALGERL